MVYQIPNNVIDIKVCSISFQRHCTSLLNRRNKESNSLFKKPIMADNLERQPLPVVELRPFSKKVWRREKSLPDFYEKKKCDENNCSSSSNGPDAIPASGRLIKDMAENRKTLESRQNTFDSALGKYRNHPKAEFLHESNKSWRKQDFIPSFITRSERTKTSLEFLSRENTVHKINLDQTSMFENALKREPNPAITINGGRMNQQIHRRHFVYLNPLETYRQPNSWVPHFNSSNPTRQNTSRDKYLATRHSFPLTSTKKRDLLLGDSQAQYPLKPIRREDTESPHKFNSKLGAAKNSLEILSKVGIQTKLEKRLEKEMELNLEKFRKDRMLLTSDVKGAHFQCLNFDANLTVGEQSLRNAREANKAAKGRPRQNQVTRTTVPSELYKTLERLPTTPRFVDNSIVNPVLHPIGQTLLEETETRQFKDETVSGLQRVGGNGKGTLVTADSEKRSDHIRDKIQNELSDDVKSPALNGMNPSSSVSLDSKKGDFHSNRNSADIAKESLLITRTSSGTMEINNNDVILSKSPGQHIDSARIETTVAYLENLQLKTSLSDLPLDGAGAGLNLTEARLDKINTGNRSSVHSTRSTSRYSHGSRDNSAGEQQSVPQNVKVAPSSASGASPTQQVQSQPLVTASQPSQSFSQVPNTTSVPKEPPTSDPLPIFPDPHTLGTDPKPLIAGPQPSTSNPQGSASDPEVPTADQQAVRPIAETIPPAAVESTSGSYDKPNDEVMTQGATKSLAGLVNPSPMNSSGIESQVTTDQEDEVSPVSDGQSARDKVSPRNEVTRGPTLNPTPDNLPASQQDQQMEGDGGTDYDQKKSHTGEKDVVDYTVVSDIKDTTKSKDDVTMSPRREKNMREFSLLEDEGISLAGGLDSSVTEFYSDQEGLTSCVDNGDSGVSTTFLTSEESMPGVLEGIVLN